MTATALVDDVRRAASAEGPPEERAGRAAGLIRERTERRWVGIYRLTDTEVRNLAWSGPAAPSYPDFPIDRGLTGAAVAGRHSIVSNDVSADPRYLTNQETTGSELIVPILAGARVVGTLDVEEATANAFSDDDVVLFEQLAAALVELFSE